MTLLQIQHVSKSFGKSQALEDITMAIHSGEVHAIIGENGAGKSTLIKILTGVYLPSEGSIHWQGMPAEIESPKEAHDLGIYAIHQDRQLVPSFTGLENLYMYFPYPKKGLRIHWSKMYKEATDILKEWGIQIPLSIPVSEMTPSERTMLEVARAMMADSKLLILDEPTASLTDKESQLLFQFIERLRTKGVAVIYISHRLEEVIQISDKVSVFRNGNLVTTLAKDEVTQDRLIHYMTDGQAISNGTKNEQKMGKPLLTVNGLRTADKVVKNVSFQLKEGEILGVYGLAGSGRTEAMEAIYGLRKWEDGSMTLYGKEVKRPSPSFSIEKGMVLIPENRHEDALIMGNTIKENMSLSVLKKITKNGILQKKREESIIDSVMARFQVKAVNTRQRVGELSGGNQQKVVFGKALLTQPSIYICDEATQAVDIMTRNEIHQFLREQAQENKGVIYVSSDLHEILEVSDAILVFSGGETVAQLTNESLTPNDILEICYRHQEEGLKC